MWVRACLAYLGCSTRSQANESSSEVVESTLLLHADRSWRLARKGSQDKASTKLQLQPLRAKVKGHRGYESDKLVDGIRAQYSKDCQRDECKGHPDDETERVGGV